MENIKNNDLSPLEKYLAVYDVVKKFKKYKENPEHLPESRFLHYILENEYIVCVGFANLMEALLHKVGISCTPVSTGIDISYVGGFTEEEKLIENVGHERNLVYLDDPKYGVKGYYLADATWDNNLEKDYYLNALMTFNRKKEAFHLETLNNEDLLFDFNSFEEFNKKINKYLIDQVRSSRKYKHQEQEAMHYAYKRLYDDLMKTLAKVDYDKFTYYYNKYNLIISSARQLDEIEPIMAELLTSYAKYILPRTNNEVTLNTIIKASSNARKILYDLNEEEALNWEKETLFINSEIETKNFPYVYDPQNELESSLEDRLESSIKL